MTTYTRKSAFNSLLKDSKNTFTVGDDYRTNPLSHTPGGDRVKAIYSDGSARIYDKIKNVDAYISYILNRSNNDIVDAYAI